MIEFYRPREERMHTDRVAVLVRRSLLFVDLAVDDYPPENEDPRLLVRRVNMFNSQVRVHPGFPPSATAENREE